MNNYHTDNTPENKDVFELIQLADKSRAMKLNKDALIKDFEISIKQIKFTAPSLSFILELADYVRIPEYSKQIRWFAMNIFLLEKVQADDLLNAANHVFWLLNKSNETNPYVVKSGQLIELVYCIISVQQLTPPNQFDPQYDIVDKWLLWYERIHDCTACPFNFGHPDCDEASNLGCLPSVSEIMEIKRNTNENWSCHKDPNKICKGYVLFCKEHNIDYKTGGLTGSKYL